MLKLKSVIEISIDSQGVYQHASTEKNASRISAAQNKPLRYSEQSLLTSTGNVTYMAIAVKYLSNYLLDMCPLLLIVVVMMLSVISFDGQT